MGIFPGFKKLTIDDKEMISSIVDQFPPYSDFNFTSLWCWSTEHTTEITTLNNNLVMSFPDYLTNKRFLTFIGNNQIKNTISELINYAEMNTIYPILKLIPESVIHHCPDIFAHFKVSEDRDNFDYIYELKEQVELKGNKFSSKRNFIKRFNQTFNPTHKEILLDSDQSYAELIDLFHVWSVSRKKTRDEIMNELAAIERVLQWNKHLDIILVGVYINNKLEGFSVNEILSDGYSMNLFEKANPEHAGIFPYLRQVTSNFLYKKGATLLNHEQDLGLEGLRQSKLSYKPKFFLKKYSVQKKLPDEINTYANK